MCRALIHTWSHLRFRNNKFVSFLQAGIRIGFNRTNGKLETSEVLYENSIFANNGNQDEVAFNCTKYGGCGGIVILNFNDYDVSFGLKMVGCSRIPLHQLNPSWFPCAGARGVEHV